MIRGMYSAISGLRTHQTMLDVTANNLANVNTVGYKSARTTFQDSLAQLQRGASGANQATGGSGSGQGGTFWGGGGGGMAFNGSSANGSGPGAGAGYRRPCWLGWSAGRSRGCPRSSVASEASTATVSWCASQRSCVWTSKSSPDPATVMSQVGASTQPRH